MVAGAVAIVSGTPQAARARMRQSLGAVLRDVLVPSDYGNQTAEEIAALGMSLADYQAALSLHFEAAFVRRSQSQVQSYVLAGMLLCRSLLDQIGDEGLRAEKLFRATWPSKSRFAVRMFVLRHGDTPAIRESLRGSHDKPRALAHVMKVLPRFHYTRLLEQCRPTPTAAVIGRSQGHDRVVSVVSHDELLDWYRHCRRDLGSARGAILAALIDAAAMHLAVQQAQDIQCAPHA